jgi:hypothetical protein
VLDELPTASASLSLARLGEDDDGDRQGGEPDRRPL